jgi:hypothetical protein
MLTACASAHVNNRHPSLEKIFTKDVARVYFLRPNMRFSSAYDRVVSIAVDDVDLLKLAKKSYTLVYLTPGEKNLDVKSYTHIGSDNQVVQVNEQMKFNFSAGQLYFVLLKPYARGYRWGMSYRPTLIDHAVALREAASLKALDLARAKPLIIE